MSQLNADAYLSKANQIWKMLDEMAESDPSSYKAFVEKQMNEAKTFCAKPSACFCLQTSHMKTKRPISINVLSWTRVPDQKSPDDPVSVSGGKLFTMKPDCKESAKNNKDTSVQDVAVVALNPSSLKDINVVKQNPAESDIVQLILDVVESQNENTKLNRVAIVCSDSNFHGSFDDLLEQTFPGISSQSNLFGITEQMANKKSRLPEALQPAQLFHELGITDSLGSESAQGHQEGEASFSKLFTSIPQPTSKPLIEELSSNSTTESGMTASFCKEIIDCSLEAVTTYDRESSPGQLVIFVKLSDDWITPILKDCFVKKPMKITIIVQCQQDDAGGPISANKRINLETPCEIEEVGAVVKYNKKKRTVKILCLNV